MTVVVRPTYKEAVKKGSRKQQQQQRAQKLFAVRQMGLAHVHRRDDVSHVISGCFDRYRSVKCGVPRLNSSAAAAPTDVACARRALSADTTNRRQSPNNLIKSIRASISPCNSINVAHYRLAARSCMHTHKLCGFVAASAAPISDVTSSSRANAAISASRRLNLIRSGDRHESYFRRALGGRRWPVRWRQAAAKAIIARADELRK